MNRLERIRQRVDAIIPTQPDAEQRRCGYVHLYGVSQTAAILAMRRGLNIEICMAMGMLHDIWNYGPDFKAPRPDHGPLGIPEAERILHETGFSPDEIATITSAMRHHSDKGHIHSPYDELLKDADVFQHYLYNPGLSPHWPNDKRLVNILQELGIEEPLKDNS